MSERRLVSAAHDVLDEMTSSGAEISLQVTVVCDGHVVVYAAHGLADPRLGACVDTDTLIWAGSAAKAVASSVANVLIERGDLPGDMPGRPDPGSSLKGAMRV